MLVKEMHKMLARYKFLSPKKKKEYVITELASVNASVNLLPATKTFKIRLYFG
jgi:hypothetical protein